MFFEFLAHSIHGNLEEQDEKAELREFNLAAVVCIDHLDQIWRVILKIAFSIVCKRVIKRSYRLVEILVRHSRTITFIAAVGCENFKHFFRSAKEPDFVFIETPHLRSAVNFFALVVCILVLLLFLVEAHESNRCK